MARTAGSRAVWGRVVVSLTLGAGLAAGAAGLPADAAPLSAYPGGSYSPPAATYGTKVETVRVRMSDGIQLKVDIDHPTSLATGDLAPGPFPVLLTQDPYDGSPDAPAEDAMGPYGQYFVQRGYIFVHANIRGAGGTGGVGGSEGVSSLFGARDSLDGLELAYWAADPHNLVGSNGRVGLQGCSFLGISQVATFNQLGLLLGDHGSVMVPAATPDQPGHSVAVTQRSNPILTALPACNNGDFYRDTFFDGGIPHPTWALFPAGPALDGLNTYDPTANLADYTDPVELAAGADLGYDRSYWQDRDWLSDAESLVRTKVPMLMWVGWNEPGTMGAPWLYAALQNASAGRPSYLPMTADQKPDPKYQLIMGDWAHAGGLDNGIELEWFDTWMRGAATGLDTASEPIHMKEMPSSASPRWINTRTFPDTLAYSPLYLQSGGALTTTAPTPSGSESLPWAPGLSTTYTLGQPTTQDMTVMGPSAVRLWASSTNTNLQLYTQLLDVAPDGSTTEITHGSILGSRLLEDPKQTWMAADGLPAQPHLVEDADRPLAPNTTVQLDIPLQQAAWRLLKGHSLRLFVASQAPASSCVSTGTLLGKPTGCLYTAPMLQTLPGGTYTILHDPAHPSEVNVAMVPSSSLLTARSATTPTSAGFVLPLDWGQSAAGPKVGTNTPGRRTRSAQPIAVRAPVGSLAATGGARWLPLLGLLMVGSAALSRRARHGRRTRPE